LTALHAIAVARLLCRTHLCLDAATADLDGAQTALAFGADDLGPIGAQHGLDVPYQPVHDHAGRALLLAGREAVGRDLHWRRVQSHATLRKVRPLHERAV
jgi:hypothetical protein